MLVLVDEGMPVQVLEPLRLNKGHSFDHVDEIRWKGKKDVSLFRDAASRGYEAILTLDVAQLESIDESRALRQSKLHHIAIQQGRTAHGFAEWLELSPPWLRLCRMSWTISTSPKDNASFS
jgi:hypothetical protein